jgi:hypothetical protein
VKNKIKKVSMLKLPQGTNKLLIYVNEIDAGENC